MRKFYLRSTLLGLICSLSFASFAQLVTPRPSPKASVTQLIGITEVTIDYSRPSVNDRKIWGKLVPYGLNNLGFGTSTAAPWRAGANENTTISFSDDVVFQGKPIKAGTYGLHIIVNPEDIATIILSHDTKSWGSFFYDPSKDALRADITTVEAPHTELLTYNFINLTKDSMDGILLWEKKGFPFTIKVDLVETVLNNFRESQKGAQGFNRQNWEQAATYSLNNGGDLEEALNWVNTAMEGQFFSQKDANNMVLKAQILKKMGKEAESNQLFEEASKIATQAQLNTMGYQMLNEKDYDRAVKYFEMAIKKDPTNANAYDSMGEAYKTMGQNDKAIKYFKKALSMNPPANVKANSEKHLKDLGAL